MEGFESNSIPTNENQEDYSEPQAPASNWDELASMSPYNSGESVEAVRPDTIQELGSFVISQAEQESAERDPLSPEEKERQEKLKRGIKIVVGGPPHSGKSVFIEALTANLNKDNTFSFSAAPDGEGPWLQRHYNDPEVVKWRQKGKFSEAFVEDRRKKIAEWDGPLMIIDVGGRTSEENAKMIEGATHAIILAGDLSKVSEWRNFFEANDIEVIAKLHSHYHGDSDLQLTEFTPGSKEHVTSSVHHLERGEDASSRETIRQTAGFIQSLVDGNKFYKLAHEGENKDPFEVFIPEVFADLPSETKHVRFQNKQGEWVERDNKTILRSAIPQIYEKAKSFDAQPAFLNGPVNSWEAMALACAFDEAGSEDIRLRGPDGYIKAEKLPLGGDLNSKWYDKMPEQIGEKDGHPVYFVHNTAHASNNPISPEDLSSMSVPVLPEDAIVVISTQGPNWLKASMALGYKDKIHAVAAFQPGEGATIAWSEDKNLLGEVIGKNSEN